MSNLAEVNLEVNAEDELDRIFGRFVHEVGGLHETIREARQSIEKGFCSEHQQFKVDLFKTGDLDCETCFIAQEQAGDEGLGDL